MSPTSIEHTNTAEIYNKQDILQECCTVNNASTNKAVCEKDGDRTCDSDKLSNAMKHICLSSLQESNEAENVAKKKTVTIIIKHNKVKHELTVSPTENGNLFCRLFQILLASLYQS
ncbi:hypothetical protein OS493_029551 [Desmophyllum pertusum]|uniref:Uncharacterized protein n=1 Tax=Desmophyllum pertusum TaxID=174260 RepID=A0A9X0D6Y3_9CNID|nr:hypothetical protein OS493_029551 [Desmophyllum pertusum]